MHLENRDLGIWYELSQKKMRLFSYSLKAAMKMNTSPQHFQWILHGTVPDSSYGHMGGMLLRTTFAAEGRVVTWLCGDRTVSKETYCVAYNGRLANHVSAAAVAGGVFDSGAAATFLPDSPHAPHRSALHVTTPVETLPDKNVTSHADSGQTAHVTAPFRWDDI